MKPLITVIKVSQKTKNSENKIRVPYLTLDIAQIVSKYTRKSYILNPELTIVIHFPKIPCKK